MQQSFKQNLGTRYTIVYEEASDHMAGEEVSDDVVVWMEAGRRCRVTGEERRQHHVGENIHRGDTVP